MIIGIGVDMVELKRMREVIEKNDTFIDRVLTTEEKKLFESLGDRRKVEFIGGRFACKEAFSKAFGTGIGKIQLTDIEILKAENGRPIVTKSPFEGTVHVTISHTDIMAIGQIILEN